MRWDCAFIKAYVKGTENISPEVARSIFENLKRAHPAAWQRLPDSLAIRAGGSESRMKTVRIPTCTRIASVSWAGCAKMVQSYALALEPAIWANVRGHSRTVRPSSDRSSRQPLGLIRICRSYLSLRSLCDRGTCADIVSLASRFWSSIAAAADFADARHDEACCVTDMNLFAADGSSIA